jgi:hypothetical protein
MCGALLRFPPMSRFVPFSFPGMGSTPAVAAGNPHALASRGSMRRPLRFPTDVTSFPCQRAEITRSVSSDLQPLTLEEMVVPEQSERE